MYTYRYAYILYIYIYACVFFGGGGGRILTLKQIVGYCWQAAQDAPTV